MCYSASISPSGEPWQLNHAYRVLMSTFSGRRDLFHLISSQWRGRLTVPAVFINIRVAAFSSCLPLPRCSAQIQACSDRSMLAMEMQANSEHMDIQWPLGSLLERELFLLMFCAHTQSSQTLGFQIFVQLHLSPKKEKKSRAGSPWF